MIVIIALKNECFKRFLSLIVYYCPGYVDKESIVSFNFVREISILWDFLKRSFLSNN